MLNFFLTEECKLACAFNSKNVSRTYIHERRAMHCSKRRRSSALRKVGSASTRSLRCHLFSFVILFFPHFVIFHRSPASSASPRFNSLAARRREEKSVKSVLSAYQTVGGRYNDKQAIFHLYRHAFLRLNMIISLPSPLFSTEYLA